MRSRRSTGACAALAISAVAVVVATASPAGADTAPQTLPFTQDWSNAALITAADDWSGVPGIVGYRGDDLASTGADPQTVVSEGTPVVDVNANQANPNTFTTGGVAEFAITDPVVALQGSGTADAPNLVVTLSTAGFVDIAVAYDVRDIDGSADNAVQQVALQYRVGTTGNFTNLPAGYIADATTGPNLATAVTPVAVTLPPAADDQPVVQVRVITADAPLSDEWVGIDNISVTGTPGGGGPAEPVASCPSAATTVAGTAASVGVSASDADSAIASIVITSPPVAGITLVPGGSPGSATLAVGESTAPGTYPVTVTFITDDDPPQSVSCTIAVSVLPITLISAVQGDGLVSPLDGDDVVVEGVVTSLFTRQDVPDGFFVQEEDADVDGDDATSEGLFVFCRGSCPTVAAGDLVQVAGEAEEFFGMTQVSATSAVGGRITVLSSGNVLPTPVEAALPAAGSTRAEATFETVEGMVVTFPNTLVVSEYFELARYGQLVLTADERPFQFTHDNPASVSGYSAFLADLATRRIILDDDNNDQNDAVTNGPGHEPYPYPSPGLSVGNRVRGGDTVDGLTGVLHWSFAGQTGTDAWRIRPIPRVDYTFEQANPVPAPPGDLGGDLKIASFNVLNYFTTIDETSGNSGPVRPVDDARLPRRRLGGRVRATAGEDRRRHRCPRRRRRRADRAAERRRRGRRRPRRRAQCPARSGAVRVHRHRLHRRRRDQGGLHLPTLEGVTPSAPTTSWTRRTIPRFIDTAQPAGPDPDVRGERRPASGSRRRSTTSSRRAPPAPTSLTSPTSTIRTSATGRATATRPAPPPPRRSPTTSPAIRRAAATPT